MGETVQIGRFRASYRLRPSQFAEKPRLDGLMREVAGEALELALERAGIRSGEIVCLRSIRLAVRLRLSRANSAIVADWARQVAEAIREAAEPTGGAVYYRSLPLALIDMGVRITQGRFERAWAWRQLDFWRGAAESASLSGAAREFGGALARHPDLAVSVLAALASQGLLRQLALLLQEGWVEIASAVLRASGVTFYAGGPRISVAAQPRSSEARTHEMVARTLTDSWILKDCRYTSLPEASSKAISLLALLEAEPWLVRSGGGPLLEAVEALHDAVFGAALLPESPELVPGERLEVVPPSVPPRALRESALGEEESALRAEVYSEFGGLLFLLRTLDELAIPERALAAAAIADRGLRWFLHRLALALQPLVEDDPAALAFCGLPPTAPPPSLAMPAPSPEEQELVGAFADEVRTALSEALPEPPRTPAALMQFVCRRQARIVADPGWIELRLDLLNVSTEIRRAGLDLDPNYVPWLGIVVRFVYE